jgi:hypothetical protein
MILYLSFTFSMTCPMTTLARSGAVLTDTSLTVGRDWEEAILMESKKGVESCRTVRRPRDREEVKIIQMVRMTDSGWYREEAKQEKRRRLGNVLIYQKRFFSHAKARRGGEVLGCRVPVAGAAMSSA